LAPESLDVQQRLLQQHKLRLDLNIEAARCAKELHQHFRERDFLQRPIEYRLAYDADLAFQLVDARLRRHPARFEMRSGHAMVIAAKKCEKVLRQIAFVALGQRPHDAEIERDIFAVVRRIDRDEDVAGVHVGMKETVAKYLRK